MHKGPKALKSSRADLVLSSSHYQNSFHTLKTHKLVSNMCIEASTTTKCIFGDEMFCHQKSYISSPMIYGDKIFFLAKRLVSSHIPHR